MLCVESANVGRSKLSLAPGHAHRLSVQLSVNAADAVAAGMISASKRDKLNGP